MFNEFLFSLDDFGKICLPHPYTTASLIFLVRWQIFPTFACRGRIRKSSNFDPIFGKTNRIRSSATHALESIDSDTFDAFPLQTVLIMESKGHKICFEAKIQHFNIILNLWTWTADRRNQGGPDLLTVGQS